MNQKAEECRPTIAASAEESAQRVIKWMQHSGEETTRRTQTVEYPKRPRMDTDRGHRYQNNLPHCTKEDRVLKTNQKYITRTVEALAEHTHPSKALKHLSRVREVEGVCECGPQIRHKVRHDSNESMQERLQEIRLKIVMHTTKEKRKERATRIREAMSTRKSRFQHTAKKKLRLVITSLMQRASINEVITSQNKGNGQGIVTEMGAVASEVIKFYTEWFASKVAYKDRWNSWEAMMALDTSKLTDTKYRSFVESAYREDFEKHNKSQRDRGIWNGIWAAIDLHTVKEAIKSFRRGKAAGPSGIAYDDLKALSDDNLRPIVELMQQFMDDKGIPQCINRDLLRPLPKTEGGLADLALTRPIALMEVLGKLFEKILFMRIVIVLEQENMIDGSQYGGMPHRSTREPIRIRQSCGRTHKNQVRNCMHSQLT